MPKIQTKISIESSERLTIKRKRYSIRAWCDACNRQSIMIVPSEAAFLASQDIDSIIYLMFSNRLHVRHVDKKGLFVCLISLCLQSFEIELDDSDKESDVELIELEAGSSAYDLLFKD
ncbi:MAG: hypothetical protein KDB79_11345 [Acidobacteria bacterium]|nr:hypothetical protein [Acidobacteriota bacterium]